MKDLVRWVFTTGAASAGESTVALRDQPQVKRASSELLIDLFPTQGPRCTQSQSSIASDSPGSFPRPSDYQERYSF